MITFSHGAGGSRDFVMKRSCIGICICWRDWCGAGQLFMTFFRCTVTLYNTHIQNQVVLLALGISSTIFVKHPSAAFVKIGKESQYPLSPTCYHLEVF